MQSIDFYQDHKYCPHCDDYRPYLMSVSKSYCAECGNEVRLFSKEDWQQFHADLASKRPKGGRPRKSRDSKSA